MNSERSSSNTRRTARCTCFTKWKSTLRNSHNLRALAAGAVAIALLRCAAHTAHNDVESGITVSCPPGVDSDADGLSDDCELALARAFAPELRVSMRGCNWDTSVQPARPGGEYYFAAQPLDNTSVRLAYLPAYY